MKKKETLTEKMERLERRVRELESRLAPKYTCAELPPLRPIYVQPWQIVPQPWQIVPQPVSPGWPYPASPNSTPCVPTFDRWTTC